MESPVTATPLVLIATSTWWPLSARMAMAFLECGCRVAALCPPGSPVRFVRGVEKVYRYSGVRSLGALKRAMVQARPALVVPCDDGVVWQMQRLHAADPELRGLIERSLGAPDGFSAVRQRGGLLEVAAELGIRIPETKRVLNEADVIYSGMTGRAVLKRSGTWGGNGVAIVTSERESLAAFRRLSAPAKASFAWKRLLVNSDPLALWSWNAQETPEVTMQRFVTGRPANAMICCWEGRVLGAVAVEVLRSQGMTGAATTVRAIQNREMKEASEKLAARLGLSGFYGLDFMLEAGTGKAFLIEMNPRCTQLGHLNLLPEGSLAGLMASKLLGVAVAKTGLQVRKEISFFPQAVKLNSKNPYLRSGFHDVPWQEMRLVEELLREGWPERRLLARMYHALKPPAEVREFAFETQSAAQSVRGELGQR